MNIVYSNDSHDESIKQTAGKRQWLLLNYPAIEELVKVREFGATKYKDPESWIRVDTKLYLEAIMRHVTAYINGESYADDSNLHHLAHAMCDCMFIVARDIEQQRVAQ